MKNYLTISLVMMCSALTFSPSVKVFPVFTGEGPVFQGNMCDDANVKDLRQMIAEQNNIPLTRFDLLNGTEILTDGQPLGPEALKLTLIKLQDRLPKEQKQNDFPQWRDIPPIRSIIICEHGLSWYIEATFQPKDEPQVHFNTTSELVAYVEASAGGAAQWNISYTHDRNIATVDFQASDQRRIIFNCSKWSTMKFQDNNARWMPILEQCLRAIVAEENGSDTGPLRTDLAGLLNCLMNKIESLNEEEIANPAQA